MRWQMGRQSDNVEDRRGMGMPIGIAGGGIGTIILIIAGLFFGFDPSVILQGGDPSSQVAPGPGPAPSKADDEMRKFVSVVLADTEDVWSDLFRKRNAEYRDPKLVLFSGAVQSACGMASAAVGPFYCPADHKVYLDLVLLPRPARSLRRSRRLRPGLRDRPRGRPPRPDVCSASPTACRRPASGAAKREANALSVRLELQADCFAGVWALPRRQGAADPGAGRRRRGAERRLAIGDDRLQKQSPGPRHSRLLHPRQLGPARRVVPARPEERTDGSVRYLRRGPPVLRPRAADRRRPQHISQSP